jgi:hypothetical protein
VKGVTKAVKVPCQGFHGQQVGELEDAFPAANPFRGEQGASREALAIARRVHELHGVVRAVEGQDVSPEGRPRPKRRDLKRIGRDLARGIPRLYPLLAFGVFQKPLG